MKIHPQGALKVFKLKETGRGEKMPPPPRKGIFFFYNMSFSTSGVPRTLKNGFIAHKTKETNQIKVPVIKFSKGKRN